MKKNLAVFAAAIILSFVSLGQSFAQSQCVVGMLSDVGDNGRGYKVVFDERMGRKVYVGSHFRTDSDLMVKNDRRFIENYFQVADLDF